jgi:tetratricopeptide (TPR) repeat protein
MNKKQMLRVTLSSLASLAVLVVAARLEGAAATRPPVRDEAAQGQAGQAGGAKKPGWKSREEYDAFQAMANEKDSNKRVQLAEAFVQKYPSSDFKDQAYQVEMATYQQLGDSNKAIEAGKKAIEANPDNITALGYLSFAFPFVFKASDPNKDTELRQAEEWSKRGLETLQNLKKPDNVTEQQFNQFVKQQRANFNSTAGFVALQRKDYPAAISSLKTAEEDNAGDFYIAYRLGLSYLYSTPPDFDNAIWNLARAEDLAKQAKSPDAASVGKFFSQVYVGRHGSDQGEQDVLTQAASSPTPPSGFKVAPPEKHKPTGNQAIDAFYNIEDTLRLGTEQDKQNAWNQIKGQPYGFGGAVDSVEKGSDSDGTLVRIDITDESKAKEGVYDIVLRTKQADAKYLKKSDLVRFQGTIAEYTQTPSFALTLDGTINQEDLDAAKAGKQKGTARTPPRRRTSTRP